MSGPSRIVSIGDSVNWGQGLLEADKFDHRLALSPGVAAPADLDRLAHSGAIIGTAGTNGAAAPGEVPDAAPSLFAQCERYAADPAEVDVVLVNGGINDVGVATILNPLELGPSLETRVEAACFGRMQALLEAIATRFAASRCRILLLGYYPILSPQSDPRGVASLAGVHGVAFQNFGRSDVDVVEAITARCEQFYIASNAQFERAIAAVGDPRIRFVPSGYTDENATFAGDNSFLWGLRLDATLDPLDPVAAQRRPLCELAHPGLAGLLARESCFRASAGHPNVTGAAQYYRQIITALA